jgi:hypothetical protein
LGLRPKSHGFLALVPRPKLSQKFGLAWLLAWLGNILDQSQAKKPRLLLHALKATSSDPKMNICPYLFGGVQQNGYVED